jgi:hypothetical protein
MRDDLFALVRARRPSSVERHVDSGSAEVSVEVSAAVE